MKKLTLLLMIILNSYLAYGQICGAPHPTRVTIYKDYPNARGASSAHCIDVFFHIVRNTNGANAFTPPNLDNVVINLNRFYSPHNIAINNAGSDFINNSDLLIINTIDKEENTLFGINNRSEAINFYIIDHFTVSELTGKAKDIPSLKLS